MADSISRENKPYSGYTKVDTQCDIGMSGKLEESFDVIICEEIKWYWYYGGVIYTKSSVVNIEV